MDYANKIRQKHKRLSKARKCPKPITLTVSDTRSVRGLLKNGMQVDKIVLFLRGAQLVLRHSVFTVPDLIS
jgi:hypothetical protein